MLLAKTWSHCVSCWSSRAGWCLLATSWVLGDFLKHLSVLPGTEAVGSPTAPSLLASAGILQEPFCFCLVNSRNGGETPRDAPFSALGVWGDYLISLSTVYVSKGPRGTISGEIRSCDVNLGGWLQIAVLKAKQSKGISDKWPTLRDWSSDIPPKSL